MKNKLIVLLLFSLLAGVLQAQTSPDLKWVVKTHDTRALTFAPDDSYIVSGGTNNELRFYNVETGEIIDTVSLPGVPSQIKFTHDGKRMIVAIPLRLALVFDAVTHELIQTIDLPGLNTVAQTISISFDDKYITYGPSDSLSIINLDDYRVIKTIGYEKKEGQNNFYITGMFTKDNQYIIVQGYRSYSNPNIKDERIFDVYDMQLNKSELPKALPEKTFLFSESGNYGVHHYNLDGYYIWKYPEGNIISHINSNYGSNFDFSKDDKYFAFTEFINKEISIYDLENNNLIKIINTDEPRWRFENIKFAYSSNLLLANADLYLFLFKDNWLGIDEHEYITNIQVVPQPSNSDFQIIFESSVDTQVSINITDITGVQLHTIYEGNINIGRNEFTWDTHGFASGTYFINIHENGRSYTQQVILSK